MLVYIKEFLARRWWNRTTHEIVNYPVNGFEARDVHQNHSPSAKRNSIIPQKSIFLIIFITCCFSLSGCAPISNPFDGKSVYDIYGVSVDKRSLYSISKDRYIVTQIQGYIGSMHAADVFTLDVESLYGYVYLIGEYNTKKEKQKLLNYVKNVVNVRKVTYYLLDKSKREPSCSLSDDASLLFKVKSTMLADRYLTGPNVHVHVVQCNVILAGIVQNAYKRDRAIELARGIKGVKSVKSFIRALH